jgi:hypothetical protein
MRYIPEYIYIKGNKDAFSEAERKIILRPRTLKV